MSKFDKNSEIPMGFGMALAENPEAMAYFSTLTFQQQQALIAHTHEIGSKKEMKTYVNGLPQQGASFF